MTKSESDERPVITRRKLLLLSIAGLGLISIPHPKQWYSPGRQLARTIRDTVTWEEFVGEVLPLAQESVRQGARTELEYLRHLAGLVAREGWEPKPEAVIEEPTSSLRQRFVLKRPPVIVCQYDVPDGAGIEAHDHYGYTAIMKVTRGQARLRRFAFITGDARDRQGVFEVRLVEEKFLGPGDLSIVTMDGANIHEILDARGGFQFVDLFTLYHSRVHSRRVRIEGPAEQDLTGATHHARWGQLL